MIRNLNSQKPRNNSSEIGIGNWSWFRASSGLEYGHIPVTDMHPLTDEQAVEGIDLMDRIIGKGVVMVHCAAGVGRTGSLISMYLIYHGMDPDDAVSHVRGRRAGSVESRAQLKKVKGFRMRKGDRS